MSQYDFQSPQAHAIIDYVREQYGDELEFLWENFPRDAIWRNPVTRKWYGLLMAVSRRKLGQDADDEVEIIDLLFSRHEAPDFVAGNKNVLPGYHMNKNNWITIVLDGSMATEQILALLDQSYRLTV